MSFRAGGIAAENREFPGIRSRQTQQQPDRGGFPGAIRSQQRDQFASANLKVEVRQCAHLAVVLVHHSNCATALFRERPSKVAA